MKTPGNPYLRPTNEDFLSVLVNGSQKVRIKDGVKVSEQWMCNLDNW